MANLIKYSEIVQQLLQDYAALSGDDPTVETELIFDTVRHSYQLVHVGWHDDSPKERLRQRRIHGCILHLDIRDGKIWLQHNGTESDIPAELIEMGVAKTDIVVGFHSPFKRQFTEYAVS